MSIAKAEVALVGKDLTAQAFRNVIRNAGTAADQISAKFRVAFTFLSGGVIGHQITRAIKDAVSQAGEMQSLAEAFGSTTEEISRLDFAAKQSNTSISEVAAGFQKLFRSISLAEDGSKRQVAALDQLELSSKHLIGIPLAQQIGLIADRFNDVKDPTDRARIAQDLFGGSVGKIVPLLKHGAEGLRKFADESDRTGATLTKEMAAKLEATEKELIKVQLATLALKRDLAIGLGPTVETIGTAFLKAAVGVKNFGEAIARAIHGSDDPVGILQEQLAELAERRNDLLEGLRGAEGQPLVPPEAIAHMKDELRAVEAEMNRINSALQQLGRDRQAAEAFEPIAKGAERAASAASILRKLIADIRRESDIDIRNQEAGILEPLGDSDEENSNEILRRMEEIRRSNIEVGSRVIAVSDAFKLADDSAKGLMETIKDESARRAFDAISDSIMGLGDGMDDFAKGTINAFRRILADHATRELFELFSNAGKGGGGGGGLWASILGGVGSLFGGGWASGGGTSTGGGGGVFRGFAAEGMTLAPNEWAIAGEKGAEAVFGGQSGATIMPIEKSRRSEAAPVVNVTINTNVDARYSTKDAAQELMKMLPNILDQHGEAVEARIITGLQRNRYDLRQ